LPGGLRHGDIRRVIRTALLLLASAALAHSQIHADFTVSHGGTPLGTFRARLDYDKAPRTCANFIGLATGRRPWIKYPSGQIMDNKPYYDGLTFHRLDHAFVIQGGSPNGQGTDGPGYVIQDEYHADLRHSGRYLLSMAKGGTPNSGGSQFFITLAAAPVLDDKHSVFGEVISGREIIDNFTNPLLFPTTNEKPDSPITMSSVVISGPSLDSFDLNNPAWKLPVIRSKPMRGTRVTANNSFVLNFDRKFQTENVLSYSMDLRNWSYFRHVRSRDDFAGYQFTVTSVTFPRFFMACAEVDYGAMFNPASPLLPSGKSITISDRSGNTLTLLSNGAGGGTWSYTGGASGTLASLGTTDYSPASGASTYTYIPGSSIPGFATESHLFPLTQLNASFGGPGPAGWTSLAGILSFHDSNSGWFEGAAQLESGGILVQRSFTLPP
jgi:peptidyl-prolyl cis-trans isomerase A (cyclophilin A)